MLKGMEPLPGLVLRESEYEPGMNVLVNSIYIWICVMKDIMFNSPYLWLNAYCNNGYLQQLPCESVLRIRAMYGIVHDAHTNERLTKAQ